MKKNLSLCLICNKKLFRKKNCIFCAICCNIFHIKCCRPLKFELEKFKWTSFSYHCVNCTLKNLPFSLSSSNNRDSPKTNYPFTKHQLNFFKNCNSLDTPFNFTDGNNKINSNYFDIENFNDEINTTPRSKVGILHINIASMN